MSRTVNEYNKLGLGCAFIMVLVLFAFLNHDSTSFWSKNQINWNAIQQTLSNNSDAGKYNQEMVALIAVWIILMILGSLLLVHIHFRVAREEKR